MTPPHSRPSFLARLAALASAVSSFRPGLSIPAGSSALAGAPSPEAVSHAHPSHGRLRRSLQAATAEGMVAEWLTAFSGGAVLTAWALYLDSSPVVLGLVTSLPQLAQLVQLPAAWCTSLYGHRNVALWAVALSRLALLPMVAVPFLPLSLELKQAMLVAVTGLAAVFAVIGNNGWVAWMGDLVPGRVRGRYFGRRTAMCTLAGTLAALLAGVLLDGARSGVHRGEVLAGLAAVASMLGAVTTWLMAKQHDPRTPEERAPRPIQLQLRDVLAPLADPSARAVVRYQISWNLAVGLAAPYFVLHMIENLKMGFLMMALHGTGVALVRMLAVQIWGRTIDRVGARPVLLFCSFGIVALPLLWLFPTEHRLWPVVLDAVLAGVMWGGHAVAAFALPLAVAPRQGRPFYLAAFATAAGAAFALASSLGGVLAQALPATFELGGTQFVNLHVLFVVSSVARLGAALLGLSIREAGSRPIASLWQDRELLPARLQPVRVKSRV